jgi:hypothetical protein
MILNYQNRHDISRNTIQKDIIILNSVSGGYLFL